jgi:phosphomannomutase/phosphoglucomutase
MSAVPAGIFKAYDIRGITGRSLNEGIVAGIGHAIGSEAISRQQHCIAIGCDGRLSSPGFCQALSQGIRKSGIDVIDLGRITTPMAYFAAHHLKTGCAVMITGSHNPPEYNGLKIVLAGEALSGAAIQRLRERMEQGDLAHGEGSYTHYDIQPDYLSRILSDVKLARPMRITVDCGNGVAGDFAARLYRKLGCEVQELYCEVDGHFPHHHPDPSDPKNLEDLIHNLRDGDSELGLAFDGDADRLGVVTREGNIIFPDRQLMLFAADMLSRHPGATVVFDVKCSGKLFAWIRDHGGVPSMWKTGHSLIKARMKETGAMLGGEMTGHVFFQERWYGFDDGLYAGARLLEILSRHDDPGAVLDSLPDSVNTPELHIPTAEGENHALLARLALEAGFPGAREIITIDGLRVEYADGFGLMRASNTTPAIVLRFEADDEAALLRIQGEFRQVLLKGAPGLRLPF